MVTLYRLLNYFWETKNNEADSHKNKAYWIKYHYDSLLKL